MNKSSESYKAYDQVAAPSAGARQAAGKDSNDCDDALGKPSRFKGYTVEAAKEDVGAARKAVNKQIGDTAIPAKRSKTHQEV